MPILTGSVGKGGNNQIHDVAVVQGALATVIGANRRPIWQGAVDGRKGKPVEDAIAAFQAANRMPPTGRLNQSGAEINRLEQALPPGHKAMRALRGTAILWRLGAGAPTRQNTAQKIKTEAPLSDEDRKALADIVERIRRSSGLDLDIADVTAIPEGRFRVVLEAPGVEWFDSRRNQFRKDAVPPDSALRALHQAVQANPRWKKATARDGILVLDTQQVTPALVGAPALDATARAVLGLVNQPRSQLAQACLAACFRLVRKGGHTSGSGKVEFEFLVEIAKRAEPGLAVDPQVETADSQALVVEVEEEKKPGPEYFADGEQTFAGERIGSTITTPRSGTLFRTDNAAWSSARRDAIELAKEHYPEKTEKGLTIGEFGGMIPELSVVIWEADNGWYFYDGLIVGSLTNNMLGQGYVGWPLDVDHTKVAGRGHMHWKSVLPSNQDELNAVEFGKHRERIGKSYVEWIGSYDGYRVFYWKGRLESKGSIRD